MVVSVTDQKPATSTSLNRNAAESALVRPTKQAFGAERSRMHRPLRGVVCDAEYPAFSSYMADLAAVLLERQRRPRQVPLERKRIALAEMHAQLNETNAHKTGCKSVATVVLLSPKFLVGWDASTPGDGLMMLRATSREAWESSQVSTTCRMCGTPFTLSVWWHHCRACGRLTCNRCSRSRLNVYGSARKERVCAECVELLAALAPRALALLARGLATRAPVGASIPVDSVAEKFAAFLMLCKMTNTVGRLVGSPAFQPALRRYHRGLTVGVERDNHPKQMIDS